MIYIGIDVGKKGAIAFVSSANSKYTEVYSQPLIGKWPNEQKMRTILWGWREADPGNLRAYIEKAQAMPKQGVTSMFSYGTLFGMWRGMLVAMGIPYEIVPPRQWQKVMLSGANRDDTKAASILVAKRLFPDVSLLPTPKCRKDSDGMADALNIAEYGRRTYDGARPIARAASSQRTPTEADLLWRADAARQEHYEAEGARQTGGDDGK